MELMIIYHIMHKTLLIKRMDIKMYINKNMLKSKINLYLKLTFYIYRDNFNGRK